MQATFAIIAALTLVSGIAAMSFRNLVHCVLCLAIAFAGLAAMYLQLDAQFVGFAQVLVYIGAVAILVVFAIQLTRSGHIVVRTVVSRSWILGIVIAVAVFSVLAGVIFSSPVANRMPPADPKLTVRQIGDQLMTLYVLPLQVIGLLLTAATIGGVIIAMHERKEQGNLRVTGIQGNGGDSSSESSGRSEAATNRTASEAAPKSRAGREQELLTT